MTDPAVKLIGVSKAFPLNPRKISAGFDTSVGAAFSTLAQAVLRRGPTVTETTDKHFVALNDINLEIAPGEVFGIIGRNGAGKSTLLKLLARVLQPTAGRIEVRGRVVSLLELGIGMADDLTVRENIHLQGRLSGLGNKEIMQSEDRILKFAGLEKFRDAYLNACPSGSFIRLAFSTVVNLKADVILADEVLAVGDTAFRKSCMEHIQSVGERGETVLFVSHDMRAVKQLCSRTAWIDRGRVRMVGDTDEVVSAYTRELLSGTDEEVEVSGSSRIAELQILGPDGNPVGAFEMNYGGFVQAIVVLGEERDRAALQFELLMGGTSVLWDTSPVVDARSSRTVAVTWRIPPKLLNEKRYTIKATLTHAAGTSQSSDKEDRPSISLDFDVYNTTPEKSVWADWQWGRGGALSPALDWSCITEDGNDLLLEQDRTVNE